MHPLNNLFFCSLLTTPLPVLVKSLDYFPCSCFTSCPYLLQYIQCTTTQQQNKQDKNFLNAKVHYSTMFSSSKDCSSSTLSHLYHLRNQPGSRPLSLHSLNGRWKMCTWRKRALMPKILIFPWHFSTWHASLYAQT